MSQQGPKTKWAKCPKCERTQLLITDDAFSVRGECRACGYIFNNPKPQQVLSPYNPPTPVKKVRNSNNNTFNSMLKMINSFGGFLALIAIILVIISLLLLGGQIGSLNNDVHNIQNSLNKDITDLNTSFDSFSSNLTNAKSEINTLKSKVSDLESTYMKKGDISSLINSLKVNITTLEDILEDMGSNDVGLVTSTTENNVTISYYPNQSTAGSTYYCHLNYSVFNDDIDLREVIFSLYISKVNISLLDFSSNVSPDFYQYENGYKDNAKITWFERSSELYAVFNITWKKADYNTTSLSTSNIEENLKINGVYFDITDLWTKEVT